MSIENTVTKGLIHGLTDWVKEKKEDGAIPTVELLIEELEKKYEN